MPEEEILHQADVENVIDEELQDLSTHAAIANLGVVSSTYVEAEANATRTTLNAVLAVLRDAGLIPAT